MKYIIDTDIGDDIDDAFALLFAMENNFDILGITTVFKNTDERARIAKKLMYLYGCGYENIPVYAGYGDDKNEHIWQYTSDLNSNKYTPNSVFPSDAVDFIIESCKKWKEELVIIAIGPFTNISKVIEKSPEALKLVKQVIIMGGAYFKQYADWNIICDSNAAKIMFDSLEKIHCIGADVTHQLVLSDTEDKIISDFKGGKAKEYTVELYKLWKEASGKSAGVLHDPLAIYYAICDSVCKCENSPVEVITEGAAKGLTLNIKSYGKTYINDYYKNKVNNEHILAKEVDKEKIMNEFMKIFHHN